LNGIGIVNGVKTVYDSGNETIKVFQGQGLASKIFTHSIPILKEAGVSSYLLEVLQHNTSAVSVYKKLGFQVSREFNYFSEPKEGFQFRTIELNTEYSLKEIDET
jgi:ribosomal protein S18 acetylase RimI-like enzyme